MKKIFTFIVALVATTALWASNTITYTATKKLAEVSYAVRTAALHTNAFNVSITSHTFSNGTGIITFAGEVTTIGNDAFYECSDLTSVTIPNSVTTIGIQAFYFCDGLPSITIPNSVTTIGVGAFRGCSSLTSVTIPNSVTTIGDRAFESCSSLKSIAIPNSVTTIGDEAFRGCSGLTSVTIGNSVTTIGTWAFSSCPGIKSVTWNAKNCNGCYHTDNTYPLFSDQVETFIFGDSVEVIPSHICHKMGKLTTISIPNSVTSIGTSAFYNCRGLTSVTLGNSITTIGESAFYYCSGLTTITIPNSVTTIGDKAFRGCSGLTAATLGNSITTIGDEAFRGCSGLTSVTLGNSITTIGSGAFYDCERLTFIAIPNSVTKIRDYAFWGCFRLIDVSVAWTSGKQLPSMGDYVFSKIAYKDGPSGATLHVPERTKSIYDTAYVWRDFGTITTEQQIPKTNVITYTATEKLTKSSLEVGATTFGPAITSHTFANGAGTITCDGAITVIGDYAFSKCSGLTSVVIPISVTTIEGSAFEFCSALTSVVIPNSVTEVGYGAFYQCSALTSVTIGKSVTTIGRGAFSYVNNIIYNGTATWETDDKYWGAKCVNGYVDGYLVYSDASKTILCGCSSAATGEITIPNSVITIGQAAFYDCSDLASVIIPNSVKTIEKEAFRHCKGLTSITIPNSVTTIGERAFFECSGLTSVTIGNSVTTIGESAFKNCYDLTSVTIPNSVATIGMGAFAYCFGLTSITIPNSVTTIGNEVFSGCSGLTSVTIPNSVTTIGDDAFFGCSGLTSITIPNSVTTIGSSAFYGCSGLTSVVIPNSVTTIGNGAFQHCYSLIYVTVHWTSREQLPTLGSNVFLEIASWPESDATLHVPEGTKSIYQAADVWKDFDIITEYSISTNNIITYTATEKLPETTDLYSSGLHTNAFNVAVTDHTFANGVGTITFAYGFTTIGFCAFYNCSDLTSVTIPNSVTTIGEAAFFTCSGLSLVTIPNSVTTIGEKAFSNCSGLTSVTIPNSVTTIGERAFFACYGLTSVTVHWTDVLELPTMGDGVFSSIANWYGPSNATLHVPEGTKNIYQATDQWKDFGTIIEEQLKTSTITYTATEKLQETTDEELGGLHTNAFNVEIISHTFSNGTGTITFAGEIATIGDYAFYECSGLSSITIPNSVTTIGEYAFYHCSGLTSVTIPNSVTTIGERAFAYCFGLAKTNYTGTIAQWCKIKFSHSSNPISYSHNFFINDEEVKALIIPEGVDTIGNSAFYNCRGLTSVTLGNSITTIGDDAFYNCSGLTSVTIPNSVTTIGAWAFGECNSLYSITIGISVTTIGYQAFSGCLGLTSVIVSWKDVNELPIMENDVFFGIANWNGPSGATLHVPAGTKSIYENADQWKDFGTITESYVDDETEVDMKPFITYENQMGTFEYPYYPSWSENSGKLRIRRDNGLQDLNLEAGVSKIIFHKTASTIGQIWIGDPNWNFLETIADWEGGLTTLEYVLSEDAIKCINGETSDDWSETAFILMGDGLEVTKIAIVAGIDSTPIVGKQFVDAISGLKFEITAVGEVNNVKVISNNGEFPTYSGDIVIPSTVNYHDTIFTVTEIGDKAFYRCSGLTSVTIPNSVTTIGDYAFYYCYGLTSVTIPNSVTTIGERAFYRCSGLTSVTIPNSVTTIGDEAFRNCTSLTSITIPESVIAIGYYAFDGCSSLPVIGNLRYADTYLVGAVDKTLSTYTIKDGTKWIGDYAFAYCFGLTSITIPESVIAIGNLAFYDCYGLTSVTIPNSVTTIGFNAFGLVNNIVYNGTATWESDNKYWGAKCVNGYVDGYLVYSDASKTTLCGCSTAATGEITIPNSVTTIGNYAFYDCASLTSVTIPNSVTTIGISAFSGCVGLTSINVDAANMHYSSTDGVLFNYAKDTLILYPIGNTRAEYSIPNSVTTIKDYAFYNCWRLTSVTIPNSVTTIGDYAFEECVSLTSVNIPNSVTTIGSRAFYGCSSLASANIPNSVTTIKSGTFQECSSLISITIPNSVTEIEGWGVFSNCTSLESVTIGNSLKTIGEGMFSSCYSLTSVNIPNSVTTIGRMAFASCSTLVSIEIPASVTTIGSQAFAWNPALASITIPKSVTTIGYDAFQTCTSLTSVTVQWTDVLELPTMGDGVFSSIANWYGPSGATLHVPAGTKSIYENADQWKDFGTIIADQQDTKSSVITYTATTKLIETTEVWESGLNTNAFNVAITSHEFSNGIGTITFAGEVTEIGEAAFYECTGLSSVTIPNSVTTIGYASFYGCSSLTSITIPNSVTTIGMGAFYECSKLTSIVIPNSVTTIGNYAFYFCNGLTSVTIGNSVTTIGDYAFLECSSLTSVTIPNSVTTIGEGAFGCSGLTSVTIPNSVTTIGSHAFWYCQLTSITIGNSVTTIGDYAFQPHSNNIDSPILTSIKCFAVNPPSCDFHTFYSIRQDTKVYVLASSLSAYQSADVWKDLNLLPLGADETPIEGDEPIVIPTESDVTITWALTDGADAYTLTITKDGVTVCVLTFNANGQLTNIAFAAPGHNGARQAPAATLTEQGYQFTITGLDPGTAYDYSVTATDAGGQTLAEHKGNFSTTGGTGLESVHDAQPTMHKVLRNGQLLIETNNATYTPMGQKVK